VLRPVGEDDLPRLVGFRRVGVMRQYERGADGTYPDGMLLDLLPGNLTDD
jgi:aminoglycoside 6'-N-acetyltransferase